MFKSKLYNILRDLNNIKSPNDALERCVTKKLNKSLDSYSKEVESTCNYLLSRSTYRVIKNIAKDDK